MKWTHDAADEICDEVYETSGPGTGIDSIVMQAIIEKHATPLMKLLAESRRSHSRGYNEESADYPPCPKSYDDCLPDESCDCGADEWNARIDEALKS